MEDILEAIATALNLYFLWLCFIIFLILAGISTLVFIGLVLL